MLEDSWKCLMWQCGWVTAISDDRVVVGWGGRGAGGM